MKKKSVSKILALGLVSVMTAGMLAGCGGGKTSDTGAAETGSADTGGEDAAGEEGEDEYGASNGGGTPEV